MTKRRTDAADDDSLDDELMVNVEDDTDDYDNNFLPEMPGNEGADNEEEQDAQVPTAPAIPQVPIVADPFVVLSVCRNHPFCRDCNPLL